MSSVESRACSDGHLTYRVVWRENGVKKSETFGDAFDASRFKIDVEQAGNRWPVGWIRGVGWRSALLTERERGELETSTGQADTVSEYAMGWIDSPHCRASEETRKRYRNHVRDHVAPSALGRTSICNVAQEDVQLWINTLAAKGLSHKTIKNPWRAVSGLSRSRRRWISKVEPSRGNHGAGLGGGCA